MEITFTKMHGLGNDFLVIDCRSLSLPESFSWPGFSRKACHRRFGIGADQIILLFPSDRADFRMGIYNADGSEVEMCGNGIRCLAKFIWDKGISAKETLEIETLAGIIRPRKAGDLVRVDMGEPVFEPEKIPVDLGEKAEGRRQKTEEKIIDYPLQIEDREFLLTCVSMGNPHAVIFLDEAIEEFPVTRYGPFIENHPIFPKRTNVEFVNVKARDELSMRVWERGSGETMACGTGASATGVTAMLKGLTDRRVTIHLLGGDLIIEWSAEDNHVSMTGPAVEVFEGKISV
ncbi:MAG: diaminopimelate epimerase [Thermodesulfovibrionales bacterium]|jgi:diaminopimelate epimerase